MGRGGAIGVGGRAPRTSARRRALSLLRDPAGADGIRARRASRPPQPTLGPSPPPAAMPLRAVLALLTAAVPIVTAIEEARRSL